MGSFQPEPRYQETRDHLLPRMPEDPGWKSSSRPQWHQGFILSLRINPECRTWTDGSGQHSCSGQFIGHGSPLGFLWAAQKTIFVFVNDLPPSQLCFSSTCFWLTSTRALRFITSRWSVQSGLGCLFWGGLVFFFFFFFMAFLRKMRFCPYILLHSPWLTLSTENKSPGHPEARMAHCPCPKLINEGFSMATWPGHRPQSPAGSLGSVYWPATGSFSGHREGLGKGLVPWQRGRAEDRWWPAQYEASWGGDEVQPRLLKASRVEGTPGFCWKIQNPGMFKGCSWK